MKIFCKNCEYYRPADGGSYCYIPDRCVHPYNIAVETSATNSYKICIKKLTDLNKNNNCLWFMVKIPLYKKLFLFLTGQKTTYEIDQLGIPQSMWDEESNTIKNFAAGDESLKEKSLQIFYKYLNNPYIRNSIEMRYMSEVDNICPDLCLKGIYKHRLLKNNDSMETRNNS